MENMPEMEELLIQRGAQALKEGNLVAFPTETVYGLGADATNSQAVKKVYAIKNRPANHPLIVHISSLKQLQNWAIDIPEYARKLAIDFWPGPLTLILIRSSLAKDFVTGSQISVGLRVPAHKIAQSLLKKFEKIGGYGIAAPSANKFGAVSPTSAGAVAQELGDLFTSSDLLLDGGNCDVGIESTIVDCTGNFPKVLRPGVITTDMIEQSTELKVSTRGLESSERVSGSFKTHYSPSAKVVLNKSAQIGDGFIALAFQPTPVGAIRLAAPKNVEDFAREIYSAFRSADQLRLRKIVVLEPAGEGVAAAIRDRLTKAAYGN